MTSIPLSTAPPQRSPWHRRGHSSDFLVPFDCDLSSLSLAADDVETIPINFEAKPPSGHRRFGSCSSAPGDFSLPYLPPKQIPITLKPLSRLDLQQSNENQLKQNPPKVATEAAPSRAFYWFRYPQQPKEEDNDNNPMIKLSPAPLCLSNKALSNVFTRTKNLAKADSDPTYDSTRSCSVTWTPKRGPTDGTTCFAPNASTRNNASSTRSNASSSSSSIMTMSPVQSLVQGVVHVVENVQEQHRKAQCKKRISQALLTLQAANRVLEEQKRQKRNHQENEAEEESDCEEQPLDWGVNVLFSPLDPSSSHSSNYAAVAASVSADDQETDTKEEEPHHPAATATANDTPTVSAPVAIEAEENFPVQILPEPETMLCVNPRLLTQTMFQQLIDEGVPECLHMNAWERVFSIGRDGDSFRTLLEHCAPYQYTILVVQTTAGHLLGGFVSDAWQEQDGYSNRHSYYGCGVSFLFCNHPNQDQPPTDNPDKPLTIYPWTGSNDFCQICDKDKNIIAMGGSGAFGFILEDDFYKGSTDRCGTFDNPPLTPDKDGIFTVAAMEVYGLVPYGLLQDYTPQPMGESPRSVAVDPKFNIESLILHNAGEAGGF